ncbi:MAG: ABC transporter permease [Treponema sp.]
MNYYGITKVVKGIHLSGNISERERRTLQSLFPFIGLLFIIIFFQVTTGGRMLTSRNLRTIFNQAFPVLLGTCGVSFVLAQGNLDFSLGSIVGTAACFGSLCAGGGLFFSLAASLLAGLLIGFLNGSIHAFFNVSGTVVTLCTQFAFRGVTIILGSAGLFLPLAWSWLDSVQLKILAAVFVFALVFFLFEYTKFGKYSRAIGAGSKAAVQSGIPLKKMKLLAYMFSGIMAGLCGFFALVRAGSVAPTTGTFFEMNVLLALVLGGMPISGGSAAKLRSALIGSAMFAFLANGLIIWGINDSIQQGVKGVILLIAVALSFERENAITIK